MKYFSLTIVLFLISSCTVWDVTVHPNERWKKGAVLIKMKNGEYHLGHMYNHKCKLDDFLVGSKKFKSLKEVTAYTSKLSTTYIEYGNDGVDDPEHRLVPLTQTEIETVRSSHPYRPSN
jgi:hypothetical protein